MEEQQQPNPVDTTPVSDNEEQPINDEFDQESRPDEGPWQETLAIVDELQMLYQTTNDEEALKECISIGEDISSIFTTGTNDAKLIIKGMTELVAEKKAAAQEVAELQRANEERESLEAQLEALKTTVASKEDKVSSNELEIREIEQRIEAAKAKERELQLGQSVDIPYLKHRLSLYATVSKIKWDFSSKELIQGSVIDEMKGKIQTFKYDPNLHSEFDLANQLWENVRCEG